MRRPNKPCSRERADNIMPWNIYATEPEDHIHRATPAGPDTFLPRRVTQLIMHKNRLDESTSTTSITSIGRPNFLKHPFMDVKTSPKEKRRTHSEPSHPARAQGTASSSRRPPERPARAPRPGYRFIFVWSGLVWPGPGGPVPGPGGPVPVARSRCPVARSRAAPLFLP